MNPELEFFLEDAFESVQPVLEGVGRVVFEPNYETDFAAQDAAPLANELTELLRRQSPGEGVEVAIPRECALLSRYAQRITLHQDGADGAWIEVAPPGNWI